MNTELTVRPVLEDPTPRVKQAPTPLKSLKHIYLPSDDGTDENLLILLHGLGDTNVSFSKLGRQLHLPQTATLAVRAPEKVPYLDEEAYQWCESFDNFGELLARPNPSSVLEFLEKLLDHLVQDCQWAPNKIHLFGFGQGGSIAVELGLRWWKNRCAESQDMRLGSIVSIGGPLMSYPTLTSLCTTPVLVFHRSGSESTKLSSGDLTAFKRGYVSIQEVKGKDGEGIPRSKTEWEPIMKFWSSCLSKRGILGLYEVTRN
ncbi:Alpha/Beta hydrolase protein [Hysterangium stoloniferum]|nr:Alpha/Beta hydrolase protein [Hysterangium stoloniferum]